MKKLLTLCLLAVTMCAAAQEQLPKIAVYVTGNDDINPMLASRLVSTIVSSHKYTAVERSAAFLTELSKEQNYQRSGAVDDDEISRLGKQFGVQFVCVASVVDVWGEKYISSRIISVETGNVVTTASAFGSMTDANSLIMSFNQLSKTLVANMTNSTKNDAKKVAVYVTKTGNRDVDIILGDQLVAGFSKSNKYLAIERTNGFLSQLSKEQGYQASGAVDDSDLARLGKQFGVNYVCVAQTMPFAGTYFISTRLVDVEKAEIVNTYDAEGKKLNTTKEVVAVSQEIAANLSGAPSPTSPRSSYSYSSSGVHADFTENAWDINMKMVWVEGGDFMMGCTSEQGNCYDDEQNVRRVTVDGYWIGMLEVTQSQWEKVMGTSIYQQNSKANANNTYGVGPDYPMYYVSWDEAMEFCRLLSNKTGKTYTLPTEAQWEYAARGGNKADGTKYAGSNMIDAVAWYADNSGSGTHPVGTKRGNALGIYDMSGNVWEWCKDWYSSSYVSYDTNNPTGPSSGSRRVFRGGSWSYGARLCRVSLRRSNAPGNRYYYLGFRVVLVP